MQKNISIVWKKYISKHLVYAYNKPFHIYLRGPKWIFRFYLLVSAIKKYCIYNFLIINIFQYG